jgi:hypothetical protein
MKKRNITLLVVGGLVLALVLFAGCGANLEKQLQGTWVMDDGYDIGAFTFESDSVTYTYGDETLWGVFTAKNGVITMESEGESVEMPFKLKDDILQLEFTGELALFMKQDEKFTKMVRADIEKTLLEQYGEALVVHDLILLQKNKAEYRGVLKMNAYGDNQTKSVNVSVDGKSFHWEIEQ